MAEITDSQKKAIKEDKVIKQQKNHKYKIN